MKFFDREKEVKKLRDIRERSLETSTFTVITGRRRVGKTELIKKAFEDVPFIYLFVTRSAESDLAEGFKERVEAFIGKKIPGKFAKFSDVFRYLLELSQERHLTVVIDEFQDFYRVNPAIFSEIQRDWDEFSSDAKMNLVVTGSVNTLMNKIFKEKKEPLYGRDTDRMMVHPFTCSTLREIISFYNPRFTADDLLSLWTYTGGVAKYVSLLMDRKAYTKKKMLEIIVEEDSYFLNEGWAVLVEEFGKDYGTYFSVLSAIARGKTTRAEIINEIGGDVGGYLTRLEDQYGLIAKNQPLFEETSNKSCRYKIDDNFFRFWFRFVFKYQYLIEVRMFEELRGIVERDYEVFSGLALEGFFKNRFIEERRYSRIGGWWDRKGENEIDLVGENEFNKTLDFYEVKRDAKRYDKAGLQKKIEAFFAKNPHKRELSVSFGALSLKDIC